MASDSDITKADFLYIGALIEKYNTFIDILILVIIIMLVCFYCFYCFYGSRPEWMMAISSMLVVCIIIYTVRRIYFTIKTDFQCVMNINEGDTSGKTNELLQQSVIDTTTKLRIVTSFMYYYILTFLGSLLWALVVFVTLYLIYLLIKINIECQHFVRPFAPGFGFFSWVWVIYKLLSIVIAGIFVPLAIFIKIPLIFYKKLEGEDGNWFFDILNWFKNTSNNKAFSIIFGWVLIAVLPGVMWYIESKAREYGNIDFLRILFYDSSHIQLFKFLDFRKTARLHLQIFVAGCIVAFTYAFFDLKQTLFVYN
jgi:hypothetical protein